MSEALTYDDFVEITKRHAARWGPASADYLRDFRIRMLRLSEEAVPVRTFIEDPDFLDAKGVIFPVVMEAIESICHGKWVEAVLTGGIGCGKTTIAIYVQAYFLYLLSRLEDPHAEYGLDPASEIEIVFQSATYELAKQVGYERFKALIEQSPYFRGAYPFDPRVKSRLIFPNRVHVKPVAGEGTSALGQNVIGGVIDEMNFMETVERSAKSSGETGRYDQASTLYASLARRRLTRFESAGDMPGMLCLVSSKNYRGQFLDSKIEEARRRPGRIYVYDRRVWEIRPDDYAGPRFAMFIGDDTRKPRMIEKGEEVDESDEPLVISVPEKLRPEFEADPLGALRDLAGISTTAIHPFLVENEKVRACFGRHESIFASEWADFRDHRLTIDVGDYPHLALPHAVHVDLAATHDSCGLAVGCVTGFKRVERESGAEMLPVVRVAGILEIRPPRSGEILFEKVREVIYKLSELGMNVKWVSFDSWQSRDSRQILQSKGYMTQEISLDKDTPPYELLKSALYDGRVEAPEHNHCYGELIRLERDATQRSGKGRIDHPVNGSKDCADALGGVVWSLSRKRENWTRYGIPMGFVRGRAAA